MQVQITAEKTIEIEEDIIDFITSQGKDYRVCTSCFGAEILPVTMKKPKLSDFKVRIGSNILYISKVQAPYITKINKSMLLHSELSEVESCFLKE